jgi:NAD-dependent deacetylase
VLKSATVSFGQSLRAADLERATAAAIDADLVLALGSTLSVYPAASIPLVAAERSTPYVIVNRGPTEHDDHPSVTLRLEGDVTVIVPPAVEAALL